MPLAKGLKRFLTVYETNVSAKIIAPELRMLHLIAVCTISVYWIVRLLTLHELFVIENVAGSYTVWLGEPPFRINQSHCDALVDALDMPSMQVLGECFHPEGLGDEDVQTCEALARFGVPFITDGETCEEFDAVLHAFTSH